MKTFFKSKKTLAGLCLVLIAVLVLGGTYSWFTWRAGAEELDTEMGNIRFDVDYGPSLNYGYLQPGNDYTTEGTLTYTGNISSLIKLDLAEDSKIIFYCDEDGNRLDPADPDYGREGLVADDDNVTLTLTVDYTDLEPIGMDGSGMYVWMVDPATEDLYLLVYGPMDVDINCSLAVDGAAGNEYMDCRIEFASVWTGTQVHNDAILAEFGVEYDTLVALADYLA